MSAKLLIGVSPRILRNVPPELGFRGKTLQYMEQSIPHWVMSLGALVAMVPTVEREGLIRRTDLDVADYAAALDGLILQGGADIDPRHYGEARTHTREPVDATRDRFELELLRAFAAVGKPVLGICRGMQLINVAFGGTLFQDLVTDGVTTVQHVHDEMYDAHGHELRMPADGWFAQINGGATTGRVNSLHHQGVKTLGQGLEAAAWSDDGVIEVIRGTGHNFIAGVQWHPEFHDGRDPGLLNSDPLMRAFLEAAAVRKAKAP